MRNTTLFRKVINLFISVIFVHGATAQNPVITPGIPPAVNQGATYNFTADMSVTWSLAPGSKGTIDPDGTYHAPATFSSNQSHGGCQLLANNHIFNVRIDTFPVHPQSANWIAQATNGTVHFGPGFYTNYINNTTPQENIVFTYTPLNNGLYRIPQYPDAKIESGWFSTYFGWDRHLFGVDYTSSSFQEMYNYYPVGTNTAQCLSCNSQGGVKYSGSTYDLPVYGSVDAAGMYVMPLSLHMQEMLAAIATGGSIKHALRTSLQNSRIVSQHIWPATAQAYLGSGLIPYGARFRLNASFDTSTFSPVAQILLRQLKQYGIIVADGGTDWEISADGDYIPQIVQDAFNEIWYKISPTNMEAVDESGVMLDAGSGDTEVNAETVIATSIADASKSSKMRVVLTGITMGTSDTRKIFQAGTAATQLNAWVNGTANTGINWTMSPALGTLTSDGIYTPPATLSGIQTTTITGTSAADPNVLVQIIIVVIPEGVIRDAPGQPSDYTDVNSNVWSSVDLSTGGHSYFIGGSWPSTPDISLYENIWYGNSDTRWDINVPNGNYRITAKFADAAFGPGQQIMHLESQGQLIYKNVDVYASAGGFFKPVDFELPATVTDGKLSFVLRQISSIGTYPQISALQIAPDPGTPAITVSPADGGSIDLADEKQFYAVGWFISNDVNWTISPNIGSIDSTGMYHAPIDPITSDVDITITATSKSNPLLTASATIKVLKRIQTVRVNCGGPQLTDGLNDVWAADYGYSGSSATFGGSLSIAGAINGQEALYQDARYNYVGYPDFQYTFPTANSSYNVTLKFANYESADQQVKMDVKINGTTVLTDFDPVAAAGSVLTAFDTSFVIPVTDGKMYMEFISKSTNYVGARINAIEFSPDKIVTGLNIISADNQQVKVYPNPFSNKATINYTLQDKGKVKLMMYDITGNCVAVLVNAEQTAGTHNVEFYSTGLAQGIYHYSLQTDTGLSTGKIVLTSGNE